MCLLKGLNKAEIKWSNFFCPACDALEMLLMQWHKDGVMGKSHDTLIALKWGTKKWLNGIKKDKDLKGQVDILMNISTL